MKLTSKIIKYNSHNFKRIINTRCSLIKTFTEYSFCSQAKNTNIEEEENTIFPTNISRKAGKKCCPYGQNGQPLGEKEVLRLISKLNSSNTIINDTNIAPEYVWNLNDSLTKISLGFYFTDVLKATDYIKEVYNLDLSTNTKQVPDISIKNKNILTIELHTPSLKGLSYRDFQLAGIINTLNYKKFDLKLLKSNIYKDNSHISILKEIKQLKKLNLL